MAWLTALGALPLILVALVLLKTCTHLRRLDRVGQKLAVFCLSAALLQVGQSLRLAAVFQVDTATTGRIPFNGAEFVVKTLVVLLYTVADVHVLFHDERIDAFALATSNTSRRPGIAPFNSFRRDEYGLPRGASRGHGNDGASGIIVRKSLDISVVRLDQTFTLSVSSARTSRGDLSLAPSGASSYSGVSTHRRDVMVRVCAVRDRIPRVVGGVIGAAEGRRPGDSWAVDEAGESREEGKGGNGG